MTKQINMTKEAFDLRGEMIAQDPEGMSSLLEDDVCRSGINAMMQVMADSGIRADKKSASYLKQKLKGGKK